MNITWNSICGEGLSFSFDFPVMIFSCIILATGIWHMINAQKKTVTKCAAIGMILASVGIYSANDLFTFYVCFELVGFLSWFCLVDEHDGTEAEVGKKYLGWLVVTGMIMTLGMFFLSHYANTLDYAKLSSGSIIEGRWMYVVAGCYLVGYGCRCALALLHPWIDTIYEKVSVSYGYFFSILLLPGGFWGLYRLTASLFYHYEQWEQVLMLFGGLTVVLGLIKSMMNSEIKLVLGYVSMAEMGWMIWISLVSDEKILVAEMLFYFLLIWSIFIAIWRNSENILRLSMFVMAVQILLALWAGRWFWSLIPGAGLIGVGLQLLRIFSGRKGWGEKLDMKWCSLERLVYIPVFCKTFPFVFGVMFRVLDQLPDGIVAFLRRTIYQDSKQRVWDKVGTPFTYVLGVVFDEIAHMLNKTFLRRHPIQKSFVNGIAVAKKEGVLTVNMIIKSLSFGLMLFCIGLCITLIYLMN